MDRVVDQRASASGFMDRVRAVAAGPKPGTTRSSPGVNHYNKYLEAVRHGAWRVERPDCGGEHSFCALSPVDGSIERGRSCIARGEGNCKRDHDDDGQLWDFVRYLHDGKGLATSAIEQYVSAVVKNERIMYGRRLLVPRLYQDWMFRMRQVPRPNLAKAPLSRELLFTVVTREAEPLVTRVACVLAFFTALRLGEVVAQFVGKYDPVFTIFRSDVQFAESGDFVKFTVRGGKRDVFNRGQDRYLVAAPPGAPFCPVRCLLRYMEETQTRGESQPLLMFDDNRLVTRAHVVALLKKVARECGVDPKTIGGHSLRIGAATALAESGIPLEEIRQFGEWSTLSSAFKYLRFTEIRLRRVNQALAVGPGTGRDGLLRLAMGVG